MRQNKADVTLKMYLVYFVIFSMQLMSVWGSYAIPYYQLNDGNRMPGFGLGTWFGMKNLTYANKADPEAMEQAVGWAIDAGYRLFDTSIIYGTEGAVGRAVQTKIAEGVIEREDVVICTKLWPYAHARDAVVPALRNSLKSLNLSYVDIFLIHNPISQYPNGTFDFIDYVETWYGMIDAKRQGLVKSIGVANFNVHMIERIIKNSCMKPAIAQFEENLTIQLESLLRFCCKNDIAVMGYTPFGSVFYERALPDAPPPRIDDPLLQQIACRHNKTVPQVILRYLVDLGVIPIPKSTNKSHIEENIDIFDFILLPEEKTTLGGYNVMYRTGKIWSDVPYYLSRPLVFPGLQIPTTTE